MPTCTARTWKKHLVQLKLDHHHGLCQDELLKCTVLIHQLDSSQENYIWFWSKNHKCPFVRWRGWNYACSVETGTLIEANSDFSCHHSLLTRTSTYQRDQTNMELLQLWNHAFQQTLLEYPTPKRKNINQTSCNREICNRLAAASATCHRLNFFLGQNPYISTLENSGFWFHSKKQDSTRSWMHSTDTIWYGETKCVSNEGT